MTRVLVLTFTEVISDPRVMRHVRALSGPFDVVTCGQGPRPQGVVEHVELPPLDHLPRSPVGLANLLLRRTKQAYQHLPAAVEARRLLEAAAFDVALANDAAAVPVAFQVARGRPVIADLHEYAPRQFEEDWRWRLMVQPFNEDLCRIFLPKAAAVTTVGDGIAEKYRAEFGVRCTTVTNAADLRHPRPRPVGQVIRAVHSGAAQPTRGLERMIAAAADVPGVTLDLYLVVSDANRGYLSSLQSRAAETGNVRVVDPVPMTDLPETLDRYDIGVYLLPASSFNALHALPNKFFDFVQSGLGIIVGPSPEMALLTERHGLGRVLPDFSETSLRTCLAELEPETVAGWKAASCRAAPQLSAQEQGERLRRVVAEVAKRHA